MDGQSVAAGVSFGIAFVIFLIVATGLFRESIIWKVDDKIRAEREDTRKNLEGLRDELRSLRRDLDGLDRQVSAHK